jgi:hypothetical protein
MEEGLLKHGSEEHGGKSVLGKSGVHDGQSIEAGPATVKQTLAGLGAPGVSPL